MDRQLHRRRFATALGVVELTAQFAQGGQIGVEHTPQQLPATAGIERAQTGEGSFVERRRGHRGNRMWGRIAVHGRQPVAPHRRERRTHRTADDLW